MGVECICFTGNLEGNFYKPLRDSLLTHTRETDNKKSREAVGLATQSQALLKPFKAKGFRLLQSVLTS